MAKKIVKKLKIQFHEETRLKKRNLSETKADIHVVSMKIENKKTLTCSVLTSFVQNEIHVTSTISKAWYCMHIEYF